MAYDGILLYAIKEELSHLLINGRIDKIYQPLKDEIVMHIRCQGSNYRLLCSANAMNPRVHLTQLNKANPATPPLFCMVLRKHLEGGKIIGFEQSGLERILDIIVEAYDELGNLTCKVLRIEIMGKHSNIVLLDQQKKYLFDALKKYSFNSNRYREMLPGKEYTSPPIQDKLNLFNIVDDQILTNRLISMSDTKLSKGLLQSVTGISPQTAKELVIKKGLDPNLSMEHCGVHEFALIYQSLEQLKQMLLANAYEPCLIKDIDGNLTAFSFFNLEQFSADRYQKSTKTTVNEVTDTFYTELYLQNRLKSQKVNLQKVIEVEVNRLHNKRSIYLDNLARQDQKDQYKLYGDLLSAHMYLLHKGQKEIEVTNFYDINSETITIPLDVSLTPSENVQKYYKRYNKVRNSILKAQADLGEIEANIEYLSSIDVSIQNITEEADLDLIKEELINIGLSSPSKGQKGKQKASKSPQTKPWQFAATTGETIWVGKNNKQNDWLTLRFAKSDDLWLHVKNIPGSHTIVSNHNDDEISEQALTEAATLAAYYSKAKDSAQVPVDYCKVKQVKKPKGAKPGMVIYEGQKTVYVTPDVNLVKKLMVQED